MAGGDGQWFYDNGSAVQGIRDAPYNNLGLFDWPPAYDILPEGVTGALQTLQSSLARDFRLATDGRLSIFSPDGTVWRTTSLQSLDVQNAQSYPGFLSIPCRTDHQHCVYENTSGLSDTLLIWVDNAAASKTALEGTRELKKLFGDPIRVVREDCVWECGVGGRRRGRYPRHRQSRQPRDCQQLGQEFVRGVRASDNSCLRGALGSA